MKFLCCLAAFSTAVGFSMSLSAAERSLELRPGDSTFVWINAKVPEKSAPLMLKLELPRGFAFDKTGFISRRFLAGKTCLTGKIAEGKSLRPQYSATNITFTFEKNAFIPVKPNTEYQVKMRIRSDLAGGEVRVLWRRGTKNGSGIGYAVLGTVQGKSDWKDVTFAIRTGRMEETAMVWFQKMAGSTEIAGTLDLKTMEILENGTALPLRSNDFSAGVGGWNPDPHILHDKEAKAVKFRFSGKGTQGFAYSEKGMLAAGTAFRTAPFFSVGKDVPEGDYDILCSGNGVDEKITVKVRNNSNVELKKLETAFWIAESPCASWPVSARSALERSAKNAGINTMYIECISPAGSALNSNIEKIPLPLRQIKDLSAQGFRVFIYLPYGGEPQYKLVEDYLQKFPNARALDWQGRPQKRICPTYLRKHDKTYWRIFQNFLALIVQKSPVKGFFWDIEFLCPLPNLNAVNHPGTAVDSLSACFCRRCIEEFKRTYGIDLKKGTPYAYQMPYKTENLPEEVRLIVTCYPMQWTQFALERTVFQMTRLREAVKKVRTDAEMRSYTGRCDRGYWAYKDGGLLRWSEWCGVNYPRMKDNVDAVMGCHDLGFYPETEAHALRSLSNCRKPVILDISTQDYFGGEVRNLYARIMNIFAFCEAQGVAFWGIWQLDGCDLTEIRRALKDVARFEDVLTEGKRFDALHELAAPAQVKATTRILGSRRVVFIINEGKTQARITLKNLGLGPAAGARWRAAFADGGKIADPGKIDLTLPGGEIRIIELNDVSFSF